MAMHGEKVSWKQQINFKTVKTRRLKLNAKGANPGNACHSETMKMKAKSKNFRVSCSGESQDEFHILFAIDKLSKSSARNMTFVGFDV